MVLGTFMIPGTYVAKLDPRADSGVAGSAGVVAPAEVGIGTATLSGRVYADNGRPVGGAVVSLGGSGFWPARSIESGADGRFQWAGIPPGIYELRVTKGELVAPPLEGLILDAGGRRAFAMRLAKGWTLAGRVRDARTGAPIHQAEVTVASGALGLHVRRTRSDRRGAFELVGVVGDGQTLYVDADDYLVAGPLVQLSDAAPLTVELQRAARIEGEVVDGDGRPVANAIVRAFGERGAGRVPAADSLGVTAGPVPPITAPGADSLAFVGQATTGRDGRFVLARLRPGAYTVAASHDAFAPAASERLRVAGGAALRGVRIEMQPGAELAGRVVDERGVGLEAIPVELRGKDERLPRMAVTASDGSFSFQGVRGEVTVTALPYDLPPSRRTLPIDDDALVTVELTLATALYTLRGRVVDERGFGIGGALLTVESRNPSTPVRRTAKSDSDGTFSVPALPEPPFALSAEHPAFSSTALLEVVEVDGVVVTMTAGVTFLGEVLDEWNAKGLSDVRVSLAGPVEVETKTRRDGTFVLRQLPTGTYDVSLSHADYEPQSRRVVIEPARYVDRPQELEPVYLKPGGVVEGTVVDANRDPVAGADVAWGDPPRWDRGVRTDAQGGFQLRGVPAGAVWITARHEVAGESWTSGPVQVRPLETSPGALVRLPDPASE